MASDPNLNDTLENAKELDRHGEDGALYLQSRISRGNLSFMLTVITLKQALQPDPAETESAELIHRAIKIQEVLSK